MALLSAERRLRYAPFRPVGDGWRFQLLLQRRAADGEWETVDESVRDSPTGAMLAMVEPFLSGERQMRVRHGLSDVPVVYRPTFMSKSIA